MSSSPLLPPALLANLPHKNLRDPSPIVAQGNDRSNERGWPVLLERLPLVLAKKPLFERGVRRT
jgi:hypothetical protein